MVIFSPFLFVSTSAVLLTCVFWGTDQPALRGHPLSLSTYRTGSGGICKEWAQDFTRSISWGVNCRSPELRFWRVVRELPVGDGQLEYHCFCGRFAATATPDHTTSVWDVAADVEFHLHNKADESPPFHFVLQTRKHSSIKLPKRLMGEVCVG